MTQLLRLQRIRVNLTDEGKLALWERGGVSGHFGHAQLICDPDGRPKEAAQLKTDAKECSEHALIPIQPWDFILQVDHYDYNFHIGIYQVHWIGEVRDDWTWELFYGAVIKKCFQFRTNEWEDDRIPPEFLHPVIEVGKEKSKCHKCTNPYYIINSSEVSS